jgi:cardiolipin synthase
VSAAAVLPWLGLAIHVVAVSAVSVRVLLRPHRDPASRIAWIVVLVSLPVIGVVAYLFFGEVQVGRARAGRLRQVVTDMPALPADGETDRRVTDLGNRARTLFRAGGSVNGFPPQGGNIATLADDSNAAVDALVADIDAATDHVHVMFYIWLPDGNGLKIAEALQRAARRGVRCRAMADDLGSKLLIGSGHWRAMADAGVHTAAAFPIGNPLLRPFRGRIDLRNHRKIVVIDGRITYCGSQNCADPEFRVKARYAPWVDIMVRFEGPVAGQNQRLFVADWLAHVDEDLDDLLSVPAPPVTGGFPAQVIGTGPTTRFSAMPEVFATLIHAARRELVITTPYYVPNESMQAALCAAGHRGVATTIVFPARNDSWVVSAASRSYYADLLAAGVRIREFPDGLLHAKTLTLDGEIALVGSANMDRRSFDLNYENNVLLCDREFTGQLRERQQAFIERSREVSPAEVAAWPASRRLWNNTIAMLGPLL